MRGGVGGEEKGKEFLSVLKIHCHSIICVDHLELFCVYLWGGGVSTMSSLKCGPRTTCGFCFKCSFLGLSPNLLIKHPMEPRWCILTSFLSGSKQGSLKLEKH